MAGTLGDSIRRARHMAGLTQEDLAEVLGITRRAYGEYERQGKIPPKRLEKIREILGHHLTMSEESAPEPMAGSGAQVEFTYNGMSVTINGSDGTTAEDIRRKTPAVMQAVMETLARLDREGED